MESKEQTLDTLKNIIDSWDFGDIDKIEFEWKRGVKEIAPDGAWKRFEPGKGRTLTVKINGGAVDEDYIPPLGLPIIDDWPEG